MHKQHLLISAVLAFCVTTTSAADVVVIANPAAAATLTKEKVADIFLGKDRSRTPIDQKDNSPIYAEFYMKATGRDVAQVKSAWARLVFGGKALAPQQLADSEAVKKAVAADPKAIGYVDKAAVDDSVKAVITLDN